VVLSRATVADGRDLVRGNLDSRGHHRPWVEPFTDQAGFEAWLTRTLAGPNLGLVAREAVAGGGGVVGVVNLNEIVAGAFQSAYLGYWGMARFAGRGLMSEAVALACSHAFRDLGLHRLRRTSSPTTPARSPWSGGSASARRASRRATSESAGSGGTTSAGRCSPTSPAAAGLA
jgi:ribosomal-protein-alanine N-acetyltransferase